MSENENDWSEIKIFDEKEDVTDANFFWVKFRKINQKRLFKLLKFESFHDVDKDQLKEAMENFLHTFNNALHQAQKSKIVVPRTELHEISILNKKADENHPEFFWIMVRKNDLETLHKLLMAQEFQEMDVEELRGSLEEFSQMFNRDKTEKDKELRELTATIKSGEKELITISADITPLDIAKAIQSAKGKDQPLKKQREETKKIKNTLKISIFSASSEQSKYVLSKMIYKVSPQHGPESFNHHTGGFRIKSIRIEDTAIVFLEPIYPMYSLVNTQRPIALQHFIQSTYRLLFFDASDTDSFNTIKKWIQQLEGKKLDIPQGLLNVFSKEITITRELLAKTILIGLQGEHKVIHADAENLAKEYNMTYLEISNEESNKLFVTIKEKINDQLK